MQREEEELNRYDDGTFHTTAIIISISGKLNSWDFLSLRGNGLGRYVHDDEMRKSKRAPRRRYLLGVVFNLISFEGNKK